MYSSNLRCSLFKFIHKFLYFYLKQKEEEGFLESKERSWPHQSCSRTKMPILTQLHCSPQEINLGLRLLENWNQGSQYHTQEIYCASHSTNTNTPPKCTKIYIGLQHLYQLYQRYFRCFTVLGFGWYNKKNKNKKC